MLRTQAISSTREDREDLTASLAGVHFPATPDDLLVLAMRRRAPSRVLWQLSRLPAQRRFASLGDVLEFLSGRATPSLGRV
jgi:hypothetical protein